jgi:hypothetical protein
VDARAPEELPGVDAETVALAGECFNTSKPTPGSVCLMRGCGHNIAFYPDSPESMRVCGLSPDRAESIRTAKRNMLDALAAAKAALPAPPELPGEVSEQCPVCGLIDCECDPTPG